MRFNCICKVGGGGGGEGGGERGEGGGGGGGGGEGGGKGVVSSSDHAHCYAKVGLVTLVDFLGIDLFLCRNSCRANQITGRAIIM